MEDDAGLPKWSSNGRTSLHTMVLGNAQRARQCQAMPGNAKHCLEHCKHLLNSGQSIALSNAQRCLKHQHFH